MKSIIFPEPCCIFLMAAGADGWVDDEAALPFWANTPDP